MNPTAAPSLARQAASAAASIPQKGGLLLAVWGLLARETLCFLRQPGRIAGAIGTPVMFWLVLGGGFGRSLSSPGLENGLDYLTFFHPAAMLMTLLFTTIFSSISVIQDRTSGFLQATLATCAPRLAIVLGKVLSSTILGTFQSAALLVAAPLLNIQLSLRSIILTLLLLSLTSLSLSALGFALAWRMRSIQGFHAVMNLLLFPMWLLSGSFFPHTSVSTAILVLMFVNPLSYVLSGLRYALLTPQQAAPLLLVSPTTSFVLLCCFAAITLCWALLSALKTPKS